jgi:anti-sigma B factor antagonist
MIATARPTLSSETVAPGVEVITLDGEFDVSHSPTIGYRLSDILNTCEGNMVVDLRGVCFLDSRMVRTLLRAFKQAGQRECELVLVRPNPMVWRVFEVGGLSEMFPSFPGLRDALDHLATPA